MDASTVLDDACINIHIKVLVLVLVLVRTAGSMAVVNNGSELPTIGDVTERVFFVSALIEELRGHLSQR